jgi:hypothetical protein
VGLAHPRKLLGHWGKPFESCGSIGSIPPCVSNVILFLILLYPARDQTLLFATRFLLAKAPTLKSYHPIVDLC